jgi:hypothetical protein
VETGIAQYDVVVGASVVCCGAEVVHEPLGRRQVAVETGIAQRRVVMLAGIVCREPESRDEPLCHRGAAARTTVADFVQNIDWTNTVRVYTVQKFDMRDWF